MKGNLSEEVSNSRIFIGTFLDIEQQERVKRSMLDTGSLAQVWQRKIRVVPAAKLHLTWLFLGSTGPAVLEQIITGLTTSLMSCQSMHLIYERAVFWPTKKRPRQLVLVPQVVPQSVLKLRYALEKMLISAGIIQIERSAKQDFKPHVTLIRLGRPQSDIVCSLEILPLVNLLPIKHVISNVCLVESCLDKQSYKILKTVTLLA